jgi:hypothetical protein
MAFAAQKTKPIYALIAILAVIATLFGLSNGHILGVTPAISPQAITSTAPSVNPVDAQPAPGLFDNSDLLVAGAGFDLEAQATAAADDIADFYADQPSGTGVNDAAFVAWASKQVRPSTVSRTSDLILVTSIKQSKKRDRAANWLHLHGCRDVWTSYALEQQRFHAQSSDVAKKSELNEALDLAARIARAAQRRFSETDSATVQQPCAPNATAADAAECDCSYPSASAALSAAARTYLATLEPRAGRLYAWMERQVDTAEIYQRFELPSDVKAGAYLGYLTARYFLASRGYTHLLPKPEPTANARA